MFGRRQTEGRSPTIVSIPQVRLIELAAIFSIFYIAREIAGFDFRTGLVAGVFIAAAFLDILVASLGNARGGRILGRGAGEAWRWATVFVDLFTVIGLVYLTGTVASPFLFLLVLPLFFAGRLLPPLRAGAAVTLATVAAIAVLGALELRGTIPHFVCCDAGAAMPSGPHFLVGTLLVIAGFMSLMTYLFATFYDSFEVYLRTAEDRLVNSRHRISELTRLYDISLGINSVISLDTLLKMVCKEITLLLRRPWSSVLLLNPEGEVVRHVELGEEGVASNEPSPPIAEDRLVNAVLAASEGFVSEDAGADERIAGSPMIDGRELHPLLAVPIVSGRDDLGILMVGDREERPFGGEDVRLISILSGQVVSAIEKSRLYEVMSGRISRLEREAEDLRNTNKLKMNYISHLSHELKTPLTSIKAYVESLQDNIDNPEFVERDEFLGVISTETDRLIRMVNKVLDVSKIEFGQRTLKRRLFVLADVVAEVEQAMQPYLIDKQLDLRIGLPGDLPKIDGDEDLVKQVFINLLGNAVKFSAPGRRLFIDAVEDAVSVKITVRDEGTGIPEKDLTHIFEQFYQVGTSMGEGVGLGLAIVKNIVEQHGGWIQVSSTVGEGASFTFTLPKEHHFNDLLGYLFESIEASEEIQEMFQLSVQFIAEMLSAKIVSLMLLDRSRAELFIKGAYGLDERVVEKARVAFGRAIAGKVAETGEPLLVRDIETSGMKERSNDGQYETKSLVSVPLRVGNTVIGVINANNKISGESFTEDDLNLLVTVSERLSKVIERMRTAEDFSVFLKETITTLHSMIATCREDYHWLNRKTVEWSASIARKLRLSEKEVQVIQYVSSVHDVGMTCVSDDILNKTLALTPEEIDEIRKHPQRGAAIMRPLEFVEMVSQNILFHHERIDGKGYPMGLKGDQIPIGSRILAVLDAYASMMGARPFRHRLAVSETVGELITNSGTQFDGQVIKAFIEVLLDEGVIEIEDYTRFAEQLRYAGKHHPVT